MTTKPEVTRERLYPNFRPVGIKRDWDHTSIGTGDAQRVLHRHGGRIADPIEAVAWFDEDCALRRLVADYADGRRADLRISKRGWQLSHTTPALSTAPKSPELEDKPHAD